MHGVEIALIVYPFHNRPKVKEGGSLNSKEDSKCVNNSWVTKKLGGLAWWLRSAWRNLPEVHETQVQSLRLENSWTEDRACLYSCLENSMDRGAWQATVHGITESDTTKQLARTHTHSNTHTHTRFRTSPSYLHVPTCKYDRERRMQGQEKHCIGIPDSSVGEESTCNAVDPGSIPGLGRSLGEGRGYTLQYSGMENSMDCIVHGFTNSRPRRSNFHFHSFHYKTGAPK